ncbi:MAG TPA: hypothetical protein VF070_27725 [Streptosporangiaceae bacterium]
MWTKSACVVLAWGILLILMAVGMKGSVRPVQANIRIASSTTNGTLTSTLNVAAASAKASVPRRVYPAPSPAPSRARHHVAPAGTSAPTPFGLPSWLTTVPLTAGLLIGALFLAELVMAADPRRRPPTPGGRLTREESRIVLADYGRLVVTHDKADDTVYVLRPPGEDPGAILRVARLVLKEDLYQELAVRLGLPVNWPTE